MLKLRTFIKRHMLITAVLVIIVLLFMVLGVHYALVVKLRTTSINDAVLPRVFLEAVATDVEYFYRTHAEQKLSISPVELSEQNLSSLGNRFKNSGDGARVYFVTIFAEGVEPKILFYNSQPAPVKLPPDSPEESAVRRACAAWQTRRLEPESLQETTLAVDESDPANRIILKPVIDESLKVYAVAGMIVDSSFFTNKFLPQAIQKHLQQFFPHRYRNDPIITTEDLVATAENLIITVEDSHHNLLLSTQTLDNSKEGTIIPLQFVFTDWRLGVRSRFRTPEQAVMNAVDDDLLFSILMLSALLTVVLLTLRTARREMKLSQMKSDFVSNVSHELRTPLSSIRVFGEFLRLGWIKEGEKVQQCGEYIEAESRRLTHIIDNILDFSRIESMQRTYQFEEVDSEEMIAETLKTLEVQLKQKGFAINVEIDTEPLPVVMADREAIAQVLINLVDNAVKYSAAAKEVMVRLGQQDGFLAISVTDYGEGIPPDEHAKIFEKFYRVSTGLVHDVKGNGLGLPIVKHIIDAHHGRITVESDSGRGSTFTVYLPIVQAANVEEKPHVLRIPVR
jgi:signal transduction histidine kinase